MVSFPFCHSAIVNHLTCLLPSGNTLGTRYKPCTKAADDLFCSRPKPSGPMCPQGPRYWHAPPCRKSTGDARYIYTFFSPSVTSSPVYSFPPRPPKHTRSSSSYESGPRFIPSPPLFSPPLPIDESEDTSTTPTFATMMFDRIMTTSPTPLSDVGEEDQEPFIPGPSFDLWTPNPYEPDTMRVPTFNPDGDDDYDAEPSSPDKTGDVVLLPDR